MTKQDLYKIKGHFKAKLYTRYNIPGMFSCTALQKAFRKRIVCQNGRFNTKLIRVYPDSAKRSYLTDFCGLRVLFIYNHSLGVAKTALTI